jgi:hypothetical protein
LPRKRSGFVEIAANPPELAEAEDWILCTGRLGAELELLDGWFHARYLNGGCG